MIDFVNFAGYELNFWAGVFGTVIGGSYQSLVDCQPHSPTLRSHWFSGEIQRWHCTVLHRSRRDIRLARECGRAR